MVKLTKSQQNVVIQACHNGIKIDVLAARFGVHPSTIDRILQRHRTDGQTVVVKRGRPRKTDQLRYININKDSVTEECVDEVWKLLSEVPFPYPPRLSPEEQVKELEHLQRQTTHVENEVIRPRSFVGTRICAPFFPNRYEAMWAKTTSALDAWRDEKSMKRAIRFQLRHGDPVLPHRMLRALTLQRRTPTIFRPPVAKFIYQRYCAPGGCVWDPCAGFGGRLLGAFAAGVNYVGTDVEQDTVNGNRELAATIGAQAKIHHTPAETFDPPPVDLVFTSPPYFDREQYSREPEQSWRKHGKTLETWIDGFIRPVGERALRALKTDGYLVLNVADFKKHDRTLPIVQMVTQAMCALGFVHVETLQMPLAAINRTNPTEPILVFRKP